MAVAVAALLPGPLSSGVAHFTKFREPDARLLAEYQAFVAIHQELAELSNSAVQHHVAVASFCARRAAGCRWAQYHALVDESRAPFAHLFDKQRFSLSRPPRRSARPCARLHNPSREQLLEQVRRSEPAVISGAMEGWPALSRWSDEYLVQRLGDRPVSVSVAEWAFDSPEPAEKWSASEGLRRADGSTVREKEGHRWPRLAGIG